MRRRYEVVSADRSRSGSQSVPAVFARRPRHQSGPVHRRDTDATGSNSALPAERDINTGRVRLSELYTLKEGDTRHVHKY